MGLPVEWIEKFAAAGMTPVGDRQIAREGLPVARVGVISPRASESTYRELRQPTKPRGALLVVPPPLGLNGVELVLAVRVVSESNDHTAGHWSARHRRFKAQATVLGLVLAGVTVPPLPVSVRWTKLGGNRLDGDNLAGSFKGLRDALAARYGVGDADGSGIEWEYDQAPGGHHGVRVLIAAAGE